MFGFDKMFDFNGDGKLDSWERAAQFQFFEEADVFGDAGLDSDKKVRRTFFPDTKAYDELEMMNPSERREVLIDAGLDPNEYDF